MMGAKISGKVNSVPEAREEAGQSSARFRTGVGGESDQA